MNLIVSQSWMYKMITSNDIKILQVNYFDVIIDINLFGQSFM